MLHFLKSLRALRGNIIRQIRTLSGIRARPKHQVLSQDIGHIFARHSMLCGQLQQLLPAGFPLTGITACEAGPGDCLATAALVLGLGASHVNLVETQPPVANEKQVEVLARLKAAGFPVDTDILKREGNAIALNGEKASYHTMLMENYNGEKNCGLIYSFCVLEHVEDLAGFFSSCFRATKPGGINVHMIDIGGHGEFEDPVPPLDFQTYPDWFYGMMYPRNFRATRRFAGEYVRAMEAAGFTVETVHKLRTAEMDYVESIRPKLRAAARAVKPEDLAVIEFALVARRPGQ
jgi:SAM-dependent methyltransferase